MTTSQNSIRATAEVKHPYLDLFLISFLILFFELACIRWFGGMVVYLTFFTNIVLLATFLGMSVGCLSASRGRDWLDRVMPLFLAGGRAGMRSLMALQQSWPSDDRCGRARIAPASVFRH